MPVRSGAVGALHARATTQPTARPMQERRGHLRRASPTTEPPSSWLRRPMATNATTAAMSMRGRSAMSDVAGQT